MLMKWGLIKWWWWNYSWQINLYLLIKSGPFLRYIDFWSVMYQWQVDPLPVHHAVSSSIKASDRALPCVFVWRLLYRHLDIGCCCASPTPIAFPTRRHHRRCWRLPPLRWPDGCRLPSPRTGVSGRCWRRRNHPTTTSMEAHPPRRVGSSLKSAYPAQSTGGQALGWTTEWPSTDQDEGST